MDLFYPRFCYGCGKMGEFLCDNCYGQLDFLMGDVTQKFALTSLDRTQALLKYEPLVAKMIHQYKYKGVRDLGVTFGYWLYQFLPLPACDAVTYIPIHKKRLAERGYNQAKIIAVELAKRLKVPCLPLLKRTIHREKQALSKNAQERQKKAAKIFASQGEKNNWPVKFPRIILVDDVVTTGATMNEAARILKEAGFAKVYGVALAHGA